VKPTDATPDESISVKDGVAIYGREIFLVFDVHESEIEVFRKHERTGWPLDVDSFIHRIEFFLDRKLNPEKPGPKKKDK
jgi:hypothetical protein